MKGQRIGIYAAAAAAATKSIQSYPTPCDPIDGSPPGSPVPRILQARTLEWVAIAFSWSQTTWAQIQAAPLVSCMAVGKLPNFSVLQLPHL